MWKALAKKFPKRWNRTADSIFDAATVMVEAKTSLPSPFYRDLRKNLNLSDRVAQALVRIGKTKRFYDLEVRSKLPDSWGTIEALSKLSVSKLDQLISSGMLNTKLKRNEIERILYGNNKNPAQDWSHTRKVITVRIDKDCKDPDYVNQIKESVINTVENLRNEYGMISVHTEDHELAGLVSDENIKKMLNEMNGDRQEGLQWGKKICMLRRRQLKGAAPKSDKIAASRRQKVFSWNMDETKFITDEDGLALAFSELGIDWIDVDDLMRDPEIGRKAYDKLLKTQ